MTSKLYTLSLLFFTMSLFSGCNKAGNVKIKIAEDALEEQMMELSEHSVSDKLLMPKRMVMFDKYLGVLSDSGETFISLYKTDRDSISFCGNYIRRGRGPKELAQVDDKSLRVVNDTMFLSDFESVYSIEINSDTISNCRSVHKFEEGYIPVGQAIRLGSGFFSLHGKAGKEYLYHSTKCYRFGYFPMEYIEDREYSTKEQIRLWKVFKKATAVDPNGAKFASFYNNFPLIRIFNTTKNVPVLAKEIELEQSLDNDQSFFDSKGDYVSSKNLYFQECYATENYIYGLAFNLPSKEVGKLKGNNRPLLYVFNWEGEPIAMYRLPKLLTTFTISADDKMFYGSSILESGKIYSSKLVN